MVLLQIWMTHFGKFTDLNYILITYMTSRDNKFEDQFCILYTKLNLPAPNIELHTRTTYIARLPNGI
jgi:hypothetical protein